MTIVPNHVKLRTTILQNDVELLTTIDLNNVKLPIISVRNGFTLVAKSECNDEKLQPF